MRRVINIDLILNFYLVAADEKDEYSELCFVFAWTLYLQVSLFSFCDDGGLGAKVENVRITTRLMLR